MYKNILVPIDLADLDNANLALEQAEFFAKNSDAKVTFIHVMEEIPAYYLFYLPADFPEKSLEEASVKLAALVAGRALEADKVTNIVRTGTPYNEVLQEAENIAADLIIIGSHLPSVTSKLLGSNASSIIRYARTSVLVVRLEEGSV